MNTLLAHRVFRARRGPTTTITIIDDEEKTSTCSICPWKIPKLHIAPAVRSLYFRLRGHTEVTPLKKNVTSSQNVATSTGRSISKAKSSPLIHGNNKIEPVRNIMFSLSGSSSHPTVGTRVSSASYHLPRSSTNTEVSHIYSNPCLPGAVEEFDVVPPHGHPQSISSQVGFKYSSSSNQGEEENAVLPSAPTPPSKMGMIRPDDRIEAPSQPTSRRADEQAPSPEEERKMEADTSPSDEIPGCSWQSNAVDCNLEYSKADASDRQEEPCEVGQKETNTVDIAEEDSELEDELDFYEHHDGEGDDDLDMDKVLRKCPPTEVLQNLTDMVQLSKNMTSQLEKALRRTARITSGPFPRLPGSGLTKAEIIDHKCHSLGNETEECLGALNQNFLTFYTVLDQMDKIAAEQDVYVSSVMIKRGPPNWRRAHAKIVRRMDKLWSRVYPKIITRKLTGRIEAAIPELEEELSQ